MKILLATASALVLLALVLWRPWEDDAATGESRPRVSDKSLAADSDPPVAIPAPSLTAPLPIPADPVLAPADLQRIRDAIDNLELTFRDYAAALGGNPVGTNPEITAALLGDNAKQLKLDLPRDSTVNAAGELCDPWGTPWFFHQLSAKKMEIRSAGPDRELYTDDDFVR